MSGQYFGAVRGFYADDARALRALAAAACCGVTTSIGCTWTPHTTVDGWQLCAWLLCVVLVVAALMPPVRPPQSQPQYWPWLSLLLPLALALRLPLLGTVPGGLHVDEMGTADFALRHVFPAARIESHVNAASQHLRLLGTEKTAQYTEGLPQVAEAESSGGIDALYRRLGC